MNLFVITMLLNMALVWLMMYFSICLMIIISICSMIIVSREYFEITFIYRKKGLCWPSVWDYLLFDIRSAQSIKAVFDAPRFEMIYDFHLQMSRKIFVHKIIFVRRTPDVLLTKIPYNLYFFVHSFLRKARSLSLRWNIFLKKGDGLLCQILIILQC